jgi:hypothetical protein
MMKFDRILAQAEALLVERPVRTNRRKLRSNRLPITSMPMNSVLTKSNAREASAQTPVSQAFTNS